MRKLWAEWMLNGEHEFTKSGLQKKASCDLVCAWVEQAWAQVSVEIVSKAFKKCGISNALDGTEDDMIWEEEELASGVVGAAVVEEGEGEWEEEVMLEGSVLFAQ